MAKIVSFEGTSSGEMGGVPGESTPDASGFCMHFDVETPSVFVGGGWVGIVQRVYIEARTEGQTLTVFLELDDSELTLGTFSTAVGTKAMTEFAVNRTGYIASVRVTGEDLTSRIEITSIEMDLYTTQPLD